MPFGRGGRLSIAMPLDLEKYLTYLDEFDLTRAQKIEVIRSVWGLMESCVDQAFGVHPVQQACGSARENNLQSPARTLDSRKASGAIPHKFGRAANDDGGSAERKEQP